jgi:cysteinyl-tRNA synthetase
MACKHLGKSFEIHGGGRDLVFPHHENEIAQSEAANDAPYANVWIHSGLLTIDHQKMSKSLGNHISIQKFISEWPPEVLRLGFLMNHYTSNIDFSKSFFQTCHKRLLYYYEGLMAMDDYAAGLKIQPDAGSIEAFHAAMSDDFNTVSAVSAINKSFKQARELMTGKKSPQKQSEVAAIAAAIRETSGVLGLLHGQASDQVQQLKTKLLPALGVTESEISAAIEARKDARAAKDFARGDAVRDQMAVRGIELRDTPQGTVWSIKFISEDL